MALGSYSQKKVPQQKGSGIGLQVGFRVILTLLSSQNLLRGRMVDGVGTPMGLGTSQCRTQPKKLRSKQQPRGQPRIVLCRPPEGSDLHI